MKAVSLHRDVIVVTSELLAAHATIIRAPGGPGADGGERTEVFVVDSPVLPGELELLGSLVEQAGFGAPDGLLATHADWDHLLGPLAFPDAPLGCAQSSAERLQAHPGAAQLALREFDRELYLQRSRPLRISAVQSLPVPGSLSIGDRELQLLATGGHTPDGMAVWIDWASVLVAGDYLSSVEIPTVGEGATVGEYLATLEGLRPLAAEAQQVVPGHGPPLPGARAVEVLEQDVAYLADLQQRGSDARLPVGRRDGRQRAMHVQNVEAVGAAPPRRG